MTTRHLLAAAVLAALAHSSAFAEGLRPVVGFALTGGGKTLLKVETDDGDEQRVSSGGLVHLFAGLEYQAPESPLSFQFNVGYHVDGIGADNGDANFSRVPVELLAFWHVDPAVRLGGGVRKATGARFTSSGAADVGDFNMRSSTGFVLQAEYLFAGGATAFARYVDESYKSNRLVGGEVSGNHAAVGMAYRF